ncbi:hypothetical protein PHLGIDRAFT_36445 [Phlebiopsis gigantea 11061_1 CR5-6]|uniref:Xylanolytic transcriptional activator regulatory domain-containing protein n=1 Tax=Phlebiopsis gigantea (strain 11061_1 CR5-6) TaxID=745531 RepID=A0A0C3RVN7_PHLG1|nr:hypothetical protein PHLGIDRAFT_36445 [Phlebiopsis gigantea 11061_1 CR5-6]
MKDLNIDSQHTQYIGRSSSLAIIRTAMALKKEYTQFNSSTSSSSSETPHTTEPKVHARTPEYWNATSSLIRLESPHPPEAFPEPVLMAQLVEAYFRNFNVHFPLLHRPTFDASIRDGLHLRNESFGSMVLLVCATGARFSDDPCVLPKETKSWHWAGWPWFQRVHKTRHLIHLPSPSLYDLQICVLITVYLSVSPVPHAVYPVVGHGLRLAQDMGAHRRATYKQRLTVEDELKKRAFWCLICMERGMSNILGRPNNTHDDDFDIDLPVECDDEYWTNDNPELMFKQPPGKPSTVSMFVQIIHLECILSRVYREIYRAPMQKFLSNPDAAQRVVSELDSELNEFISSLPDHLKWGSQHSDPFFQTQSALLHASYYTVQITVHRSFIPRPGRPSPLSFPSLAICTNAARSSIRVMDKQYIALGSSLCLHWYQTHLFVCSVILLLNVWYAKLSGAAINPGKELREVTKAMHILHTLESRWSTASRLWDVLNAVVEAMSVCYAHSGTASQERPMREPQSVVDQPSGGASFEASPFTAPEFQTQVNWNHDTAVPLPATTVDSQSTSHVPSAFPQATFDFTLPLYSDELGSLPIWSNEGPGPIMNNPMDAAWDTSTPSQATNFGPTTNAAVYSDEIQAPMDIDIDAIFAALLPDSAYDHTLGIASDSDFPYFAQSQNMASAGESSQYTNPSFNYANNPATGGHGIPEWM